jgi:immune inhibitor A
MRRGTLLAVVAGSIAIFICGCILFIGLFGIGLLMDSSSSNVRGLLGEGTPTGTPVVYRPTIEPGTSSSDAKLAMQTGNEVLSIIRESVPPENDLYDLAKRLEGKLNIPEVIESQAAIYDLGSEQEFWVSNIVTNENYRINAKLQYITDHAYFWVQDGISFEYDDIQQLTETFENEIYDRTREFFGSEWSPGIDNDPHIFILYVSGLGGNLAGYFSSADELHPLAHQFSNAHELFVVNADNVDLSDEFTYAILAHEFQHMIHWNQDRNEASWMNEGFAELAVFINGYEVGSEYSYILDPDIQLNDWPNDRTGISAHYGASFLFLTYFLDRFGEEATKILVRNQANGLEGVDRVLEQIGAIDPVTGIEITADNVFLDWVLASYLMNENVSDGRYIYKIFPNAPQAEETESIGRCPQEPMTRDVHQYGVDYLRINCQGDFTLLFEGSTETKVVPVDPISGEYYFWSNKADEADMTLTRTFDFREHDGPLTLNFWTWFDLEEDYDYAYVEVSEDGEIWEILVTPSGTIEDPSGNSYGWGYNGVSGRWIEESVDLTEYAGKEVQIRFEYVTDAAVNGEGMLIDDISIPEIDYFTDFEEGSDGWESAGWVRIKNELPQHYGLALITFGDETIVTNISLQPDTTTEIPISLNEDTDEAVLVVTGLTRYTRQKAAYRIEIIDN